jgi:hypothetical protein
LREATKWSLCGGRVGLVSMGVAMVGGRGVEKGTGGSE